MNKKRKNVVITWSPRGKDTPRAHTLARLLDFQMIHLSLLHKKRWAFLIKFPYLSLRTLLYLLGNRPKQLIVEVNQPIIVFSVWMYALLSSKKGGTVIWDLHSGPIVDKKWRLVRPLMWRLLRRGDIALIHDRNTMELLSSKSVKAFYLPDPPPIMPREEEVGFPLKKPYFVFPSSGSVDEPLDLLKEVWSQLDGVHLYITGRKESASWPTSVTLTGFLPYNQYIYLVKRAVGVLGLTKRPYTLLGSAYEALFLGVPLLLSDTDALRLQFKKGAIFTRLEPESFSRNLRIFMERWDILKREIEGLKEEYRKEWHQLFSEFKKLIDKSCEKNMANINESNLKC